MMSSLCLVKEPYDSRTFRSNNVFLRKPEGAYRTKIHSSKNDAWYKHRGTWGTAIYELPIRDTTLKDRNHLKAELAKAKLPPCSIKGHRHYGALAEPITLLEGDVDIANKGVSGNFCKVLLNDVMGNHSEVVNDKHKSSTAQKQRDLNTLLNEYGKFRQPHTQACLNYTTSLKEAVLQKSTQQQDYVEHKSACMYEPLPQRGVTNDHIKTPFARKAKQQQAKYSELVSGYYKTLYKSGKDSSCGASGKSNRIKCDQNTNNCCSPIPRSMSISPKNTTPEPQPAIRSRSAMMRSVSEATSTSEVSCSLAILPGSKGYTDTRQNKLGEKITDTKANRQMSLKRSNLAFKCNVPPVQFFLSATHSTQTDSSLVNGLNPVWPPANKSDNAEMIGYPNLSLPVAINTLLHRELPQVNSTYQRPKAMQENKNVFDGENFFSGKLSKDESYEEENSTPHPVTEVTIKIGQNNGWKKLIKDKKINDCVKTNAHAEFLKQHASDWVPRIWDYNYLLFHLNRRKHRVDEKTDFMSCHASHIDDGLIG